MFGGTSCAHINLPRPNAFILTTFRSIDMLDYSTLTRVSDPSRWSSTLLASRANPIQKRLVIILIPLLSKKSKRCLSLV